MGQSIEEIQRLLQDVVGHLRAGSKGDRRKAADKLNRIASIASTMSLTLQTQQ